MTGKEVPTLFARLAIYHPNAKQFKPPGDLEMMLAWLEALKKIPLNQCLTAAADHVKTSNYPPDVGELIRLCPPEEEDISWMREYLNYPKEQMR